MYSVFIAYLLLIFGGVLGVHRFYMGKIGTGLLYLLTGGLAGIGCIYDFFTLPMQVRERNMEERYRRALSHGDRFPARELPSGGPSTRSGAWSSNWSTGKDSIEKVILRTAKNNNGIATPVQVSLDSDISLDDAKKNLEKLVSKGFAEVRVSKSGNMVYVFPDFADEETDSKLEDF